MAPDRTGGGLRESGDGGAGSVGGVLRTLNLAEAEEALIEQALAATDQNRTRASDLLGISVRTLRSKLNRPEDG